MLSNPKENASFLMGAPVTAPEATKLVHEGDTVTAAGLTFTVRIRRVIRRAACAIKLARSCSRAIRSSASAAGAPICPRGAASRCKRRWHGWYRWRAIWKFTPDMETKMSNEIQQGLQDDLTTIEPDLMNMTRLFSRRTACGMRGISFRGGYRGRAVRHPLLWKNAGGAGRDRHSVGCGCADSGAASPPGASPSLPSDALRPAAQGNRHSSAVGEHDGHSSDAPDVRGAERRHVDGGRAETFGAPV